MSKDHHRETMSIEDAGRMLGLGRSATYRAANRGDLPTLRIGGRLLVLRRPFERLLNGESEHRAQSALEIESDAPRLWAIPDRDPGDEGP